MGKWEIGYEESAIEKDTMRDAPKIFWHYPRWNRLRATVSLSYKYVHNTREFTYIEPRAMLFFPLSFRVSVFKWRVERTATKLHAKYSRQLETIKKLHGQIIKDQSSEVING
jgi:hypothetical protein